MGQNWLLLLHYGAKDGTGWDEMGYYYYTIGARMGQGGTKLVIIITLWGRELDSVGQNSKLSLHSGAKTE